MIGYERSQAGSEYRALNYGVDDGRFHETLIDLVFRFIVGGLLVAFFAVVGDGLNELRRSIRSSALRGDRYTFTRRFQGR